MARAMLLREESGALLGGVPLAQGSVYFRFARRTANRMTAVVAP